MADLFDIKCKNCGTPVGYDIVRQTYRCPSCGMTSGIQEAHRTAAFRRLNREDLEISGPGREIRSCPNCGAEILCEEGEGSHTCSFCGGSLVRREFVQSEDFPSYIVPFILTKEEAKQQLKAWAEKNRSQPEGQLVLSHLEELQGYYLPYELVRGPAYGYVLRENVDRKFYVRGYIENSLVNTSRQLDNETLDAAEPYDLSALRPFEYGYLAGHKTKLADLSGELREKRMFLEAEEALKPQLSKIFHTDGVKISLVHSDLMSVPVLLPAYLFRAGKQLVVVNGQTGRVAVRTEKEKKRSPLWKIEPAALMLLAFLSLWLATGFWWTGVLAAIPIILAIFFQYREGRFSIFGTRIAQGHQVRARRVDGKLQVEETPAEARNPFPLKPIFWENFGGRSADVSYRFYPPVRVLKELVKTLGSYFLPCIAGAVLHFVFGLGNGFQVSGALLWFMCFGIFSAVYIFSGIRGEAYEHPFVYMRDLSGKQHLVGTPKSRQLSFLVSIGMDKASLAKAGQEKQKKARVLWICMAAILLISIYMTITVA